MTIKTTNTNQTSPFFRPKYAFSKKMRLLKSKEYKNNYSFGRRVYSGPLIAIAVKKNESEHSRIGLSVAKKVGTAVYRNRIKRFLRECFRTSHLQLLVNYDLVIVVKKHNTKYAYYDLEKHFTVLLDKINRIDS